MPEDLKALNRRFNKEVIEQGNVDLIDDLVAEDFIEHLPLPGQAQGPEGLRDLIVMFRSAFPDIRIEWLVEAAEGDVVAGVSRVTATHQGEFMGIPPTGKQVSVLASDIARFRDGKFVERWGFFDQATMMEQLGVAPGGPQSS